ncbi:hypothetical protein WH91_22010 [Devosia psychrophila]|uniref:Uncharacterized protein n=1 Tax=Devosia psychrophila TaxID=728005 RepID=A0ABR5DSL2_9HYPH|nr:hypothetical protein WH91_22010 [Devosia psychrophila]
MADLANVVLAARGRIAAEIIGQDTIALPGQRIGHLGPGRLIEIILVRQDHHLIALAIPEA